MYVAKTGADIDAVAHVFFGGAVAKLDLSAAVAEKESLRVGGKNTFRAFARRDTAAFKRKIFAVKRRKSLGGGAIDKNVRERKIL